MDAFWLYYKKGFFRNKIKIPAPFEFRDIKKPIFFSLFYTVVM